MAYLTSYADTWTKVTSEPDLTTDGEYLLVCESKKAVMGSAPAGTNTYLPSVSVSNLANGTIETNGTETFGVVSFEGLLTSCKVKISALDGTVKGYYTTSVAKKMSLSDTGTDATVSLSDGNIIIEFGSYGTLIYNSSAPRFVTYANGQTDIQIFKRDAGGSTKIPVALSYPEKEYAVNIGETFISPILTVDPEAAKSEVVYESSDNNVAKVDKNGNVSIVALGSTVISATISESETYSYASAEYTLNVVDPNNPSDKIVFATKGYSNQQVITTVTQGNTTLTFDKGSNTNTPKYYENNKDVRLYGGGSLTISVPEEYVLTKVISTYKNIANNLSANNGAFNTDYTVWTADATTKNTVVFTESGKSGNRSWTEIEVYYTKAGDPSKSDVTLTFDGEDMTEMFEAGKQVQGRIATASVEGMEITYSSSDETVAKVDASSGLLTLAGPGTTTITAQTAATDEYNAGQASYTLTVEIVYNSIADVLNYAKNNDIVDLNFAMTVGHVNGKYYVYVTDNKGGYILIYGTTDYTANDVIPAGMSAKYTIYNGLPELAPQTKPAATEQGTYEIETVAAAEVMNQPLNKIVMVEGVTFAEATPGSGQFTGVSGETTLDFYNQLKLASVEAGDYDVMVTVSTHKSGATAIAAPSQLQPIKYYALPGVATATINGAIVTESFKLKGEEVTVVLTAPEGTIWYKFTETATPSTPKAAQALDGYQAYPTEGIKIGRLGILEYYSELNGHQSDVSRIEFTGTPTSISEIEANSEAATEYYDLSGRRVNAPVKGIVIKKTGSKVSKVVF